MIYKSRYLDIVLIIVFIYSVFFIVHKFLGGKVLFWDFHIIYCASKTFFGTAARKNTIWEVLVECWVHG